MGDRQLDRAALRFKIDDAARVTFSPELRPKLMSPFQYDPARTSDLDDLAGIRDPAIWINHFPCRPHLPVRLEVHAEPVLLHELRCCESLPQFVRRCPNVSHVDEA